MATALELLLEWAPPDCGDLALTESGLKGRFCIQLPDGSRTNLAFVANEVARRVSACEYGARQLPSACPQRHINYDGSFCLGYAESDPGHIETRSDAVRWWEVLYKFLRKQALASQTGRWTGSEWGHGTAAHHQRHGEAALIELGQSPTIFGDLKVVVRGASSRGFVRVFREKKRWYTVDRRYGSIVTNRRRCPCGSARAVINCPDRFGAHKKAAVHLADALVAFEREEARFWQMWRDRACCGTMKDCPLRQPSAYRTSELQAA